MTILTHAWEEYLHPLLKRPDWIQVAALCWRMSPDGKEILLITSRGTGRWILPKGWPNMQMASPETALREAWEEAGVTEANINPSPIVSFASVKRSDSGLEKPCRVDVYEAQVHGVAADYPESTERQRRWVSPMEASEMVDESGLRAFLSSY